MLSFAVAILTLGFLVFIHEFGHFVAAKMAGMRVEQFSIGMGPKIASIKKGETDYIIGAIPAGGFVMVSGITSEERYEGNDDPRLYQNKTIFQRFLFAVAGPFMNLLTAVVILMVMGMVVGVSVPDADAPAYISQVSDNGAAAQADILAGDKITAINGQPMATWSDVDKFLVTNGGSTMAVTLMRNEASLDVSITPRYSESEERFLIGVTKEVVLESQKLGFIESFYNSISATARMSTMILDAVGNLASGQADVTDENEGLTGPVGIVKVIDASAQEGVWSLLLLTAILSVNLGLLNLLPIPALDGSRIVFLLLEAVRGRAVSTDKEGLVNFVGFVFLMFLMIYVTYNDIVRLIS